MHEIRWCNRVPGDAKSKGRVPIAPTREQPAMERPVGDRSAADIPRSECDVMTSGECPDQIRNCGRIVGQVDVHRHDDVIALIESSLHCVAVRAAETHLGLAMKHLHHAHLGRELFRQITRTVRTVVVDNQDCGVRYRFANTSQEQLDVVALVVRRSDDQNGHGRRGYPVGGVRTSTAGGMDLPLHAAL